jgi:hypothetical protein
MYLTQVRAGVDALDHIEKAAEIIKAAHLTAEEMYISAEDKPVLHLYPEQSEENDRPDGDGEK